MAMTHGILTHLGFHLKVEAGSSIFWCAMRELVSILKNESPDFPQNTLKNNRRQKDTVRLFAHNGPPFTHNPSPSRETGP
jgi:hypothetical protein